MGTARRPRWRARGPRRSRIAAPAAARRHLPALVALLALLARFLDGVERGPAWCFPIRPGPAPGPGRDLADVRADLLGILFGWRGSWRSPGVSSSRSRRTSSWCCSGSPPWRHAARGPPGMIPLDDPLVRLFGRGSSSRKTSLLGSYLDAVPAVPRGAGRRSKASFSLRGGGRLLRPLAARPLHHRRPRGTALRVCELSARPPRRPWRGGAGTDLNAQVPALNSSRRDGLREEVGFERGEPELRPADALRFRSGRPSSRSTQAARSV